MKYHKRETKLDITYFRWSACKECNFLKYWYGMYSFFPAEPLQSFFWLFLTFLWKTDTISIFLNCQLILTIFKPNINLFTDFVPFCLVFCTCCKLKLNAKKQLEVFDGLFSYQEMGRLCLCSGFFFHDSCFQIYQALNLFFSFPNFHVDTIKNEAVYLLWYPCLSYMYTSPEKKFIK